MLSIPGQVRIFLAVEPVDMRQGFDRLAARVSQTLQSDPLSGHLFVFRNRRADRVKLLYWDGDGYAIWYKRLEAGTFRFPAAQGQPSVTVSAADWAMLLDGVDLSSVRRGKRFQRAVAREAALSGT